MADEFKLPKITKDELEIAKELHKEHGGCFEEIVMIIECQSRLVRKVMEAGELHTVRLHYLGKFEVAPYQAQKVKANASAAKRRKLQGKG
ncbi:hypothetical protein [Phaeodactylibacter xiamenensis]|jgi:hypothetical protein|uniref:hypothetical protein n=1 Tax=Phaeodactylibacter xiamenensis TaxID=1524460 RepID=UPI003CCBA96C